MTTSQLKPRILVVEDTPEHAHILIESLHDDFAIMVAINGERGLLQARGDNPPDLILLDVLMPGLNGKLPFAKRSV